MAKLVNLNKSLNKSVSVGFMALVGQEGTTHSETRF